MTLPDANRPLVTFILVAYNQEAFVKEAIAGALAQTYEPMEIILSDDCSPDGTFKAMQDCARDYIGPKTIILRQNPKNVGLIPHFNTLLEEATGELIVIAAGDDISMPNRTTRSVDSYLQKADGKILIHSDAIDIDINSNELGRRTPPRQGSALARQQMGASSEIDPASIGVLTQSLSMYIGATGAISKSLLHEFEPIRQNGAYEDQVWGFRAVLCNALHYIAEPLVKYRVGIGLSGTTRGRSNFSFEMRHLLKSRKVSQHVLSQRLIDLKRFEDSALPSALQKGMAKRLRIETLCVKIHDKKLSVSDMRDPLFISAFSRVIFSVTKVALWAALDKFTTGIRRSGTSKNGN